MGRHAVTVCCHGDAFSPGLGLTSLFLTAAEWKIGVDQGYPKCLVCCGSLVLLAGLVLLFDVQKFSHSTHAAIRDFSGRLLGCIVGHIPPHDLVALYGEVLQDVTNTVEPHLLMQPSCKIYTWPLEKYVPFVSFCL